MSVFFIAVFFALQFIFALQFFILQFLLHCPGFLGFLREGLGWFNAGWGWVVVDVSGPLGGSFEIPVSLQCCSAL